MLKELCSLYSSVKIWNDQDLSSHSLLDSVLIIGTCRHVQVKFKTKTKMYTCTLAKCRFKVLKVKRLQMSATFHVVCKIYYSVC